MPTGDNEMSARNTTTQWGWVSRGLHWLMAALILVNFALGWVADDMHVSPAKLKVFLYHKSIGLTVLALVLIRLLWRLHGRPDDLSPMPRWQRLSSRVAHGLLYFFMLALPLTGWYLNSVSNVPLRWFGWLHVPAIHAPDRTLKAMAENIHTGLGWALAAVIMVHVAGALHHHFVTHDDILRRMLRAEDTNNP